MPGFSVGNAVNSAAAWLCTAPLVRGVVCNPVATALLITAVGAVVVMAVYNRWLKGSGFRRGARALLYVFLAVSAITFVHHYAVSAQACETASRQGVREVFSGIQQSRLAGPAGAVPVPLGGPPAATGGAPPLAAPRAEAPAFRPRPDNVWCDGDPLSIEDVVVPLLQTKVTR